MLNDWRRPEEVALPTVWARFRGLRPMGDGRVPDFWIQCVRPEDDDAVLDFMEKHFLPEEETCRAVGLINDAEQTAESRTLWQGLLTQRASLAAWTDWPNGTPRLVGCNILYVRNKSDPPYDSTHPVSRKVTCAIAVLESKVDLYARHGVTEYLSGVGLSALPEFRGQGLGLELLRARTPLCRALRLRVTATIFTGAASQKQADRAGFHTLAELRYADYEHEGKRVFASIKGVDAMVLKEMVVSESQ